MSVLTTIEKADWYITSTVLDEENIHLTFFQAQMKKETFVYMLNQ